MTLTPENAAWFAQTFSTLTDNVGKALLGKAPVIRLALTCMLAAGHLLLEASVRCRPSSCGWKSRGAN